MRMTSEMLSSYQKRFFLKAPPFVKWHRDETAETRIGESTITLLRQVYGALSDEDSSPLSRVSVANSSFSLDPFRGCPGGCAYCTVTASQRDVIVDYAPDKMSFLLPTKPELLFGGSVLADALIRHPAFVPHRSI